MANPEFKPEISLTGHSSTPLTIGSEYKGGTIVARGEVWTVQTSPPPNRTTEEWMEFVVCKSRKSENCAICPAASAGECKAPIT